MTKINQDIKHALHETYWSFTGSGDGSALCVTYDEDAIQGIFAIFNLTDKIINSTAVNYSLGQYKSSARYYMKMTSLGKKVVDAIQSISYCINQQLNSHKLHPRVELFLRYAKKFHLKLFLDIGMHGYKKYVERCIRVMNSFVCRMKKQAATGKLVTDTNKFQRSARKNNSSLVRYINKLFDLHARLLVMRIDFGYRLENKHDVTAAMVQKHRKMFFANTRMNGLFDAMLGYAWKMEYGLDKGFHYHMLFFFDGSKVREDVSIAKQIGEYWNLSITDGIGVYFNCNRIKNSYKSCGIGMINHHDYALRDGLKNAVLYMTKTDNYIKLVLPGNARIFGKGEIAQPKLNKRGRPRVRLAS